MSGSEVRLPDGYVAPPLERVPGGVDDTGDARPLCRPDTHENGKHSVLCLAGILGYRRTEQGDFERYPPHPMAVPGARWTYEGGVYVRPMERGVCLDDETDFAYIEELPEGHYDVRIEFVRRETER